MQRLLKNSISPLLLGGAALQRRDHWFILNLAFSRRGQHAAQQSVFQQPLKRRQL
jgi:hypothetical protein